MVHDDIEEEGDFFNESVVISSRKPNIHHGSHPISVSNSEEKKSEMENQYR